MDRRPGIGHERGPQGIESAAMGRAGRRRAHRDRRGPPPPRHGIARAYSRPPGQVPGRACRPPGPLRDCPPMGPGPSTTLALQRSSMRKPWNCARAAATSLLVSLSGTGMMIGAIGISSGVGPGVDGTGVERIGSRVGAGLGDLFNRRRQRRSRASPGCAEEGHRDRCLREAGAAWQPLPP